MTDLSIVVVTWNTRDLVIECLVSIDRALEWGSKLAVEILVVDNGSTDGTCEAVRECFPDARLIARPRNGGFAAGANHGIREASGRHILLLNSDAKLEPGTLEACVGYLDDHPDVGIVGPQLVNPDGSRQNSIHNFPMLATELLPKGIFQFFLRRRFPSRRWTGSKPVDVEAVVGAALFVRRSVVRRVGALCEDYFFFLEETDWCWRVRKAGWRVVLLPSVEVIHLSGASSKRKYPALTKIEYHRSLYRFFRTYRGMTSAALPFAVRFAKALFYVVSKSPSLAFGAVPRARWLAYRDVFDWHVRGCPRAVGLGDSPADPLHAKTERTPPPGRPAPIQQSDVRA